MIHIVDDLYITGDPLNISLTQEKESKKEGGVKGEKYYVDLGHYNTFQELLDGLTRKKIRLGISQAKALMEIGDDIQEIHDTIRWFCNKFKKEIEDRMQDEQYTVKVPVYRRVHPMTTGIDGFVCEKIGERTIPANWAVKAIVEPREGDKNDGESGEADQSDSE
jgi:hypothetical protein